jgi:hypothetical protein
VLIASRAVAAIGAGDEGDALMMIFAPCQAQEDLILEHLANDHVIRQVSNIKSEELGVRQYRWGWVTGTVQDCLIDC